MTTILIDCMCLAYQSFYGMHLAGMDEEDQIIGNLQGFLSKILSIGMEFNSNDLVFCWDSKHSYRKDRYDWYKAGRLDNRTEEEKEGLDIMRDQVRRLRMQVLPQMGFRNQLIQPGCESDDVIAKLAMDTLGDYLIVSTDEDMYQLLSPSVSIYSPSKRATMTAATFQEKYDILPMEWVRVKQIAGCKSDSVPGIMGVGEKTAIKYIREELKVSSKKYQAIKDGSDVIKRNESLVRLPLPMTKLPIIQHNRFSLDGLTAICDIHSLQEPMSKISEWKRFFDGIFSGPDLSNTGRRSRGRRRYSRR